MKTFKEFLLMEEELKDYNGDIVIKQKGLTEIPVVDRFNRVSGIFDCANNELPSLKGSPVIVTEHFNCHNNQLTSLQYAPKEVGGDFLCFNNKLTSLKYLPSKIGGRLYCSKNKDLFEVSPLLNSKIDGWIYFTSTIYDELGKIDEILNKYKNNPKNLIKMLAELKQIDKRFC